MEVRGCNSITPLSGYLANCNIDLTCRGCRVALLCCHISTRTYPMFIPYVSTMSYTQEFFARRLRNHRDYSYWQFVEFLQNFLGMQSASRKAGVGLLKQNLWLWKTWTKFPHFQYWHYKLWQCMMSMKQILPPHGI